MNTTPTDPFIEQSAQLMHQYGDKAASASGIVALLDLTREAIAALLRRTSDTPHRDKTQAVLTQYFEAVLATPQQSPAEKLVKLKIFCTEIIHIVLAERPLIAARARAAEALKAEQTGSAPPTRRMSDTNPELLAGQRPERMQELAKLAEPPAEQSPEAPNLTERAERLVLGDNGALGGSNAPTQVQIIIPAEPPPTDKFGELFIQAMCHRIERVTCFFHRHNPDIARVLPRPFLLSPAFSVQLSALVRDVIAPQMRAQSRNLALIENSRRWDQARVSDFWSTVEANDRFRLALKASWDAFWQRSRQRPVTKPGINGKTVLMADPLLQDIRQRLAAPAGEYVLPTIRNPEIDLLTALAFEFNPEQMETLWNRLRQLYEQEMDTRAYQDKARDGALRDSFLTAFDYLPDQVGDFMVILCYFCFPNVGLFFLDRFTHNKGKTVEERRAKLPYLMQFLDDPRVDRLKADESRQMHAGENR